jgi:hypothetical protein
MNNPHISQTELLKLASNKSSISVHSLGQWVKNQTDEEYIIINRNFLIQAIEYIKKNRHTDHFLGHDIKEKWNFEELRNWL